MAASPAARADDLGRSDKLKVLYSNQFAFDRRGVPLITVRIAEGLKTVTLSGDQPLSLLPDGEEGAEVTAKKRWKFNIDRAHAAELEHYVELGRAPAGELSAVREQTAAWRERGVKVQLLEVGAVFGVKGTVFDNRAHILAAGPYPTRAKAEAAGRGRFQRLGLKKVAVIPQIKKRPTGEITALSLDAEVKVRTRDVLWVAPRPDAEITVEIPGEQPRRYWGQIYVTVDRQGALAVVNALPADRLLAGLVPAEIFPSAPDAALQAQAVAARGELLAKIGIKHIADPYLLCSTQHCQVYAGAGQEHPRTTRAVKATRGMVLLRRNTNRLVDTVYSASCGGHTEHNDHAWQVHPDPTLRGHLDAPASKALAPFADGITDANIDQWLSTPVKSWCGRSRFNRDKLRWTVRLPAATVDKMVRKLGVGQVKALRVLERGVSGRATRLEVVGRRATSEVRGELTIRRLLGGLRSSMFVVTAEGASGTPSAFVFRGGGWGHGVGMCQTGAIGMALAKKSYTEILEHYYTGSEVKQVY